MKQSRPDRYCSGIRTALIIAFCITLPAFASGEPASPASIRSREIELHYRLVDCPTGWTIDLWYTRDRGASWHQYAAEATPRSPLVFTAPGEGLYGFILAPREKTTAPSTPPPHATPQRWIFVDYTPPLVQWDGVEPAGGEGSHPQLQLRWTAFDDHFPARPVSLAYQTSDDSTWHIIDAALPNVGRYDWTVPASLRGQVTVRLTVHDLGGHVVERLHGPVSLDRFARAPTSRPTSQPALPEPRLVAATRPSGPPEAEAANRKKAEELYQQASWSLVRGQYPVAAERLQEALELAPDMLPAITDLAGIHCSQKDYDKALQLYHSVLSRNAQYAPALRGAALAYAVRKQYPQARDALTRLLAVDQKDANAWLDLGDVMFMLGSASDARAHWSRAATLDVVDVARKARRRLELYGSNTVTGTADARPSR